VLVTFIKLTKLRKERKMEGIYIEDQTFFNNGQFTETEMDLMSWGLNDLLQKINAEGVEAQCDVDGLRDQMDDIEELIEKLQEGS
tara:strand:+ start:1133 stop:1387 length:255 start_codon:yes stop_codon:yes gene_type:complete